VLHRIQWIFLTLGAMLSTSAENIPEGARVIVAEAVWQYSHHVLGGLRSHQGPILTVGNWSPEWPGLVGLLNLNASLTKANRAYATTWTADGSDAFFERCLREWLDSGAVEHDTSHVRDADFSKFDGALVATGKDMAAELRRFKAIMGIFDEGCMGMYNAFFGADGFLDLSSHPPLH
jgi:hypothetical protein